MDHVSSTSLLMSTLKSETLSEQNTMTLSVYSSESHVYVSVIHIVAVSVCVYVCVLHPFFWKFRRSLNLKPRGKQQLLRQ